MMRALLSSNYWPNLHYFFYLLHSDEIWIDAYEHFEKQSFRTRCTILSANGPLDLSLPIHKSEPKQAMHLIRLSDSTRWRAQHYTAIASAYGKAPYFEYFADDIKSLYAEPFDYLTEFNAAQLKLLLKIFRLKLDLHHTSTYQSGEGYLDLRSVIHPKRSYEADKLVAAQLSKQYYQSFGSKFPFQPNLSVLDALFNQGLDTIAYLKNKI